MSQAAPAISVAGPSGSQSGHGGGGSSTSASASASASSSRNSPQYGASQGAHISRAHSSTPINSNTQTTSPGSPRGGGMDVDTLIRAAGGSERRALEDTLAKLISTEGQNRQLWKLLEKQRTQCAQLAGDNERLRADRERANSRLISAGLDPVSVMRRGVTHSVSTSALSTPPTGSLDLHHRRDEGRGSPVSAAGASAAGGVGNHAGAGPPSSSSSTAPTTSRSTPGSGSGARSPDSDSPSPSVLLPSPMPDRRLRHESRMTFPPEVASFMALADKDHPPPAGLSLDGGSSAAAAEVFGSASGSAGGLVASWAGHERSQSPIIEQDELGPHLDTQRLSQDTVTSRPTASPVGGGVRESIESSFVSPTALSDTTAVPQLQSQSQPEHVQFTPAMLPWTTLTIPSTSVFPDKNKHELLAFIIAVKITSPALSWTVGKTLSAFNELDSNAQKYTNMSKKEWRKVVGPLPDGKAWKDLAPGKIDQRKMQCETFLQKMLTVGMNDKGNDELHRFLTTDVIQRKTDHIKEGYLTKRGQKFGGWKTRYFVLDQSVMKYYETRGGALMGSIQIKGAQVGSQVPSRRNDRSTSDDEVYKYAILIKDGRDNHILCASTIAERDHWIEALVAATEAPAPSPPTSSSDKPPMAAGLGHQRRRSAIRAKASKDVIVTSAQPMSQLADANAKFISGAPLPSMINKMENDRQHPPGGGNNSTLHLVHLPPPSDQHHSDAATPKPIKRQSALPGRQSFSPAYLSKLSSDGLSVVPGYNLDRERKAKSGRFWGFGKAPERGALRPVFGVPLADSIAIASVASLPAIVFRCIEYLEAKRAEQEEGIYRLSGSSTVIKGLKERFNHEGDVNLLQLDERWDPHAIAGLLKTYLRELPTPLLTRELHMRFLAVIDLVDPTTRVAELSRLVSELPLANYTLLRAFTAHLILIVKNSAVNKMTLRNIGIVFSPTLGIPAGIFYELVSRFGAIFDDEGVEELPLDEVVPTPAAAAQTVAQAGTGTGLGTSPGAGAGSGAGSATDNGPVAGPNSSPGGGALSVDEGTRNKRNSVLYHASGADAMLGLAGRALDPSNEDAQSEVSLDDIESEQMSAQSSDGMSLSLEKAGAGNANAVHETAA